MGSMMGRIRSKVKRSGSSNNAQQNAKTETQSAAAPPPQQRDPSRLLLATWNIAGINNNPWEYYVSLDDPEYNELMLAVEEYLTTTGRDVMVSEVLESIDPQFLSKVGALLGAARGEKLEALLSAEAVAVPLGGSLVAFLESAHFGSTRLISWPDRLLNTIDAADDEKEREQHRPTAINYYPQRFEDAADWFRAWLSFMASTGMAILERNKNNKYATKYAAFGDEAAFLSLNVALLAVFDALLIFMLFELESSTKIKWQAIKRKLGTVLNEQKLSRTVSILRAQYGRHDVLFLQEVRGNFAERMLPEFHVLFPAKKSKNNQSSVICLSKARFERHEVVEVTDAFFAAYSGKMDIGRGDLVVYRAAGFLFASFHGDTGGMATADVVRTVHRVHAAEHSDCRLIFGLDANTYSAAVADGKKKYSAEALCALLEELSMESCFGGECPVEHTTNGPRTYLQPQLNKAVRRKDIDGDHVVFRAPKDWILWSSKDADCAPRSLRRDNTGHGTYRKDRCYVIPSSGFPSDHAIVSAEIVLK